MDSWKTVIIKEVCEIKPPKREASQKLSPNDLVSFVPMENLGIFTKDLSLESEKPLAEVQGSYTYFADNDVLLAKITPCFENGKLGIARNLTNGVGFGSSEYVVLRSKGSIDPEYLFYFLSQDSFRQNGARVMTGAVGHKRVPKEFIENHIIPLPPLPEQRRIVSILDEAFAAIDQARANAERNKANARELFNSYLNAIFSSPSDDWEEKRLGDVCELKSGTTVDKKLEKEQGEIPYLKVADMSFEGNETEVFASSRYLDMDSIGKNAVFPVGTTIFPKRGGAILTNKKRLTAVPICADLNIMGAIPSAKLDSHFLYYYFLNVDMKKLGSGSSIPQINNYDINPLTICFPKSLEAQRMLVRKLDLLVGETKQLEVVYQQEIDALDELKQSVLHQAFTGQLAKAPADILEVIPA